MNSQRVSLAFTQTYEPQTEATSPDHNPCSMVSINEETCAPVLTQEL